MISFIVQYKNGLKERREITIEFLEMMDKHLRSNLGCECIISDYESEDGLEEVLTSYETRYLRTKANSGEYFNTAKCLNNAFIHTNHEIIAPIAIDLRFRQLTINLIEELYRLLGSIIIRVGTIRRGKERKEDQLIYSPYILRRDHILKAHGWDERMHGWGKEDDDLIDRILMYQDVLEIRIRAKGIGYIHLWHEPSPVKTQKSMTLNNANTLIYFENVKTNGKNLKNSYW